MKILRASIPAALALLIVTVQIALSPTPSPAIQSDNQEAPEETEGSPAPPQDVLVAYLHGPIGPVSKDYVHRIVEEAGDLHAGCIVFLMDTPGGLDASMRSIIKDIFSSPVPIIIFVYPSGARAASAGAIISLAAHIVAMAPGTNMGAAHPVPLGQGKMDDEMTEKITNDSAAYARSIATKRGRDLEWAEKIVRESISSTAEEAHEVGVVDIVASDLDDLLEKLDGLEVDLDGRMVTLRTAGADIREIKPSLRERFLGRISDPNIAYLLMLLGFFGLIFELQNPGAIFPGVIGAISILLAFYALQLLPVNYAGVALIVLAIIMFLLEIKIPSGGLLTVGGVVAMVIGSIMFIDSPLPFMRVSLSVIIPAVVFTVLFFVFAVGMGLRAQRKKVSTGTKGIIGEIGVAKTDVVEGEGSVFVHGEFWNAYSDEKIPAGKKVEVVDVNGMMLKVKPHKEGGI
ncbi:MAG: nodulation protein NfeD [Candidatus Latescibacteria bacterium]|nr:nodulation protein NfeD [Candidatus Latescibacterota bacterium]NIM21375.1 nodulation protein NfeD [Candidatus Latescibacterota bacterium]NIM65556.1 nodulation protein NfeD [Candidatus Latescibacterota bacterium]NIO01936.1 nodulation protein NfeD [Candidatus Latescibacterota bacterium]NIO28749.1 nodulation protein NfeD [Candidatus Latescibacterota bacterium]